MSLSGAKARGMAATWDMLFSGYHREGKSCKQTSGGIILITLLSAKAGHMVKFNVSGTGKYTLLT